jgi:hypothetical protein
MSLCVRVIEFDYFYNFDMIYEFGIVFFVLSYYVSEFSVVMSVTISAWNRCSVRLCLQFFVGGLMSYLRYLSLFGYSCVNTLMLCLCFVFLRLVCTLLPVPLDCPFLIVFSVFSNVYFRQCGICSFSFYSQRISNDNVILFANGCIINTLWINEKSNTDKRVRYYTSLLLYFQNV